MKNFFGVISKKVFMCFSANLGRHFFEAKKRWALFLPGFSGILPRFSANQNVWGALAPPVPQPPTPLLFITAS